MPRLYYKTYRFHIIFAWVLGLFFVTAFPLWGGENQDRWYILEIPEADNTDIKEAAISQLWSDKVGRPLTTEEKNDRKDKLNLAFDIIKKKLSSYEVYINKALITRYWDEHKVSFLKNQPKTVLWLSLKKSERYLPERILYDLKQPNWLITPAMDLEDQEQIPNTSIESNPDAWFNTVLYFKNRYRADYVFISISESLPLTEKNWFDYYWAEEKNLQPFRSQSLLEGEPSSQRIVATLFNNLLVIEEKIAAQQEDMSLVFVNSAKPEALIHLPEALMKFPRLEAHVTKLQPNAVTLAVRGTFEKKDLKTWLEKELAAFRIDEENEQTWKVYIP